MADRERTTNDGEQKQEPTRVYTWSYVESGDVAVTEKDARDHMDRDDTELTEEHWKAAARYQCPEFLDSCLDLDDYEVRS